MMNLSVCVTPYAFAIKVKGSNLGAHGRQILGVSSGSIPYKSVFKLLLCVARCYV